MLSCDLLFISHGRLRLAGRVGLHCKRDVQKVWFSPERELDFDKYRVPEGARP